MLRILMMETRQTGVYDAELLAILNKVASILEDLDSSLQDIVSSIDTHQQRGVPLFS